LRSDIYSFLQKIGSLSKASGKKISKKRYLRNIDQSIKLITSYRETVDTVASDFDKSHLNELLRKHIQTDILQKKLPKTKISLRDAINISLKYLKINRKYILISVSGLLLFTLIISQSLLLTISYEQNHFDNYLEGKDSPAYNINVLLITEDDRTDFTSYVDLQKTRWSRSNDLNIINIDTSGEVEFDILMGRRYNLDSRKVWVDTINMRTYHWTKEIYDLLSLFPTFPDLEFNPDEPFLLVDPYLSRSDPQIGTVNYTTSDFILNGSFSILVDEDEKIGPYTANSLPSFNNYTLPNNSVSDIWHVTTKDLTFNRNSDNILPTELFFGTLFLPKNEEWELAHTLKDNAVENGLYSLIWGRIGIRSRVDVEIPLLNNNDLDEISSKLGATLLVIRSDIMAFLDFYDINSGVLLNSPLRNRITDYDEDLGFSQYLIPITMIPMILISLFLLFFSLNLIEKWKERIFSVLKQRGASLGHIRMVLIVEIFAVTTVSVIIGMLSSVPLTAILLRSSDIFQFNLDPIPIIIPSEWYWKVPVLTLLITVNFYVNNIINADRINILESFDAEETKPPIWRRINLDIILFSIGILFWIIAPNLPLGSYSFAIFAILGPIAIMCLIFGFPLVVSRYFINIIKIILSFIALRFEMILLAVNNIKQRKYFTSQLIALIIISIMLSLMALVVPVSFNQISEDRALYELGSEIYIENINFEENQSLLNIDGIESYTHVKFLRYFPSLSEISSGEKQREYQFLGINKTTFASAAYWEDKFADTDLDEIISSIDDHSVALQSNVLKGLELSLNDNFTFSFERRYINYLAIESSFDYFPHLVYELPEESINYIDVSVIPIVASLSTIDEISAVTDRVVTEGVYINVKDDFDVIEVSKELKRIFGFNERILVSSYLELKLSNEEEGQYEFLITIMHIILLVSMVINIIAISFYNYITVTERNKEIAIFRAFGMVKNQISLILFAEITSLVLVGIITGIISGIILSIGLFTTLSKIDFFEYPVPVELSFEFASIMIYVSAVVIISILSAFYPVIKLSRISSGSILRAT
jgi:ABC-type lipoprotein release transport system permease subunit